MGSCCAHLGPCRSCDKRAHNWLIATVFEPKIHAHSHSPPLNPLVLLFPAVCALLQFQTKLQQTWMLKVDVTGFTPVKWTFVWILFFFTFHCLGWSSTTLIFSKCDSRFGSEIFLSAESSLFMGVVTHGHGNGIKCNVHCFGQHRH